MDIVRVVFVPILPDHFTAFVVRRRGGGERRGGGGSPSQTVFRSVPVGLRLHLGTVSTELPTRCLLAQLTSGREKITAPCMIEEL